YNIVVEGNTLKGTGQAAATTGCNGIWLVNDATAEGPGNRVLITNNVIEGFDRGIALDDEVPIFSATGNLCIDCNYGIQSPVAFESVKNNQFDTCDYGLYSSVAGPWGGGNTFLSVTTEVGNDTDTRFSPLTLFDIQKFTMFDDFDGDVLRDQWNGMVGSDPACVLPTILSATGGGVVRLRSGASAAATMAANGCQLDYYLQWNASFGGLLMQVRFRMSAIAGPACFLGLTDQIDALEMPFTIAAGNVFTSNATDAVGLTYN